MNTTMISKEAILKVSRELIQRQGWSAVNIRSVAKECHISIGSIYNYFDSKTELIAATVESVWCDIFHFPDSQDAFRSFSDCIIWLFACMEKGEKTYPGFFTLHSMSFLGESRSDGQQRMKQSWQHIQNSLCMILKKDPDVRPDAFDEAFPPEKFVELIFSLILSALLQHNYDCSGILGMIQRILY